MWSNWLRPVTGYFSSTWPPRSCHSLSPDQFVWSVRRKYGCRIQVSLLEGDPKFNHLLLRSYFYPPYKHNGCGLRTVFLDAPYPGLPIFQEVHVRTLAQTNTLHPPTRIRYADNNLIRAPTKPHTTTNRHQSQQNFDCDFPTLNKPHTHSYTSHCYFKLPLQEPPEDVFCHIPSSSLFLSFDTFPCWVSNVPSFFIHLSPHFAHAGCLRTYGRPCATLSLHLLFFYFLFFFKFDSTCLTATFI